MFLLIDLTMKMWVPHKSYFYIYICSCLFSSSCSVLLYFLLPEPIKAYYGIQGLLLNI